MVAYNFQKRFVAPIRANTKRQTIRAERAGRSRHARPGEAVQLYFGLRTKHTRLIAAPTCESVSTVTLDFIRDLLIFGDDRCVDEADHDAFAADDGFADWQDMREFWEKQHPGVLVFSGVLIRWAPILMPEGADLDALAGGGQLDMFPAEACL